MATSADHAPLPPVTRRWYRRPTVLALALILGTALFLRFGYDRGAGSHLIEVIADAPGIEAQVQRFNGEIVPPSELIAAGWSAEDDGWWQSTDDRAVLSYRGLAGDSGRVVWRAGPPGAAGRLLVGGEEIDVDLSEIRSGQVVTPLGLRDSMRPTWWLLLVASVVLTAPVALILSNGARRLRTARGTRRLLGVGCSILAGSIAVVALWPVHAPPVQRFDVTVSNEGLRPPGSNGREVWVALREQSGDLVVSPAELRQDGWEVRDDWVISVGPAAPLHWSGTAAPGDYVELRTSPFGGQAGVLVNGDVRRVDVYSPSGSMVSLPLGELTTENGRLDILLLWLARLGDVALVAALIGLVVLAVGKVRRSSSIGLRQRWETPSRATASVGDTLKIALVPFVGLSTLLIILWPGPLNPDMIVQWQQLENGDLDDWHPYAVGLLVGVLRWIVDSPWLAITVLTMCCSFIAGRVGAWAVAGGLSMRAAYVRASALAVLLPVGLMMVTLWKDSIFGLSLLALTFLVWRVEGTRGHWLRSAWHVLALVIVMTVTWLTRHNGWPVIVVTMVALLWAHRAYWRRLVFAAAATLCVVAFVKVPLANTLDVEPSRVDATLYIQRIAMHLNAGTDFTADEREFLGEIHSLDSPWPYDCSSVQATWSGPGAIPLNAYVDRKNELRSLAVRLALRNPLAEVKHIRCSSRIIWQPSENNTTTYLLEWYVENGRLHYIPAGTTVDLPTEDPPSPRLAQRLYDVTSALPMWIVRPALYLYALIGAAAYACWRRRNGSAARVALPAVAHSILLVPVSLVQDVRFQLGVMLVAIVFVPVLITGARRSGPPPPPVGQPADERTEPLQAKVFADR